MFLAAGTMIGSTVLTLPLEIAPYGWQNVVILMLLMCLYSFYVAMYTVEANLFHKIVKISDVGVFRNSNESDDDDNMSIGYLAGVYLNKFSSFLSSACIAGLFFSLLSAYIAGVASIFSMIIDVGFDISCVIVGFVSAALITFQNACAKINRFLFLSKMIAFCILIAYCIVNFSSINLMTHTMSMKNIDLGKILPLFFTAFGFHGSIPYIMKLHFSSNYNDTSSYIRILKNVFFVSSLITLSVYLIWIFIVLSNVSNDQLIVGANVSDLIVLLTGNNYYNYFHLFVRVFAFCALMTSVIGVGFGLIDFVKEIFTRYIKKMQLKYCYDSLDAVKKCEKYNKSNITYVISTFFVFFICTFIAFGAQFLFIKFLSFAALCLLFIAVIMPCLIVFQQRYVLKKECNADITMQNFITFGGKNLLIFNLLVGIILIVIDCYFIFF